MQIVFLMYSTRYNKLALDGNSPVEEVDVIMPVRSDPLINLPVQTVAMGTSHAVAITGQ